MPTSKTKKNMACNKPQKSWKPSKKRVVKACSKGKEKIIHFGATGFGHNYNSIARKNFRARHKCDTANDKLTARFWACKNLWSKGGDSKPCPKNRRCKGTSPDRSRKRKSPRRSPRRSPLKSPNRNSPKRKSPKRKSPKRKSPKRKSTKRKSPKRKSPKRRSPNRKSRRK